MRKQRAEHDADRETVYRVEIDLPEHGVRAGDYFIFRPGGVHPLVLRRPSTYEVFRSVPAQFLTLLNGPASEAPPAPTRHLALVR